MVFLERESQWEIGSILCGILYVWGNRLPFPSKVKNNLVESIYPSLPQFDQVSAPWSERIHCMEIRQSVSFATHALYCKCARLARFAFGTSRLASCFLENKRINPVYFGWGFQLMVYGLCKSCEHG